jgi:hypothetical protein
MEKENV